MVLLGIPQILMVGLKKKRRGVAGLISVITIVLVFGMAATALLQITAKQTSLANTITKVSKIDRDRLSEKLAFDIDTCRWNDTSKGLADVTIKADNNWGGSSSLDSFILLKPDGNVTDAKYIPDQDTKISALTQDKVITITAKVNETSTDFADKAFLVTQLGNKAASSFSFSNSCVAP